MGSGRLHCAIGARVVPLDIEKAVNDVIQRATSDDKRALTVGGAISEDELRAEVAAELGKQWTLGALFRRFRKTKRNEFGIGVTKEF